jgi:exodeoxyribonuclease VII large subunit
VQGTAAADQIAAAIRNLNRLYPRPDVLLIGRGGGSMEDLWCFNDERVARAIADSKIPTVSCVGHETDFTIADFVADLRAPTPSAAAEMVSENNADTLSRVSQLVRNMIRSQNYKIQSADSRLKIAFTNKFLKDPLFYIEQKQQEVDELEMLMKRAFLDKQSLAEHLLKLLMHKLNILGPEKTLKRGFSIVRKDDLLVKSSRDVSAGNKLVIQTADGNITATTEK